MKIVARILLVVANLLSFCVLGAWYFFAFDIQWGLTWQAVTWGLPTLVGTALVIVCVVLYIRRRKWRWGLAGIGVAVVTIICTGLILCFFSQNIVGAPENGPEETPDTEENRIMTLVLKEFFGGDIGYEVIKPEMYRRIGGVSPEEREHLKEFIIDRFHYTTDGAELSINIEDENVLSLIDRFLEINQDPGKLTIPSSPEDGYYIDYDGKFSRYFQGGVSAGWTRWRLTRPNAGSSVDLLLPAYDAESGLILMYIGMQGAPLTGFGDIFLFQYKDGEFKTLGSVMVWIS